MSYKRIEFILAILGKFLMQILNFNNLLYRYDLYVCLPNSIAYINKLW